MKALVLYAAFVIVGASLSVFVGLVVERELSSNLSLIVFLAMFFANFVVAWIMTVLVMDGSLRNIQGRQEQLDAERVGRVAMAKAIADRKAGALANSDATDRRG